MSSEEPMDATAAVPAVVLPEGSDLTPEEALVLDREIDEHLGACEQLRRSYLDTGHRLARMKETRGFAALGYRRWGDYLDSKERYRRTFLSYLLKLGRAGDPQVFIDNEMPPAAVIQYISQVDYPEKVHALIAATWDEVKDLPAKAVGRRIKQYVEVHAAEYKKPRKRRVLAPPQPEAEAPHLMVTAPSVSDELPVPNLTGGPLPPDWECRFEALYRELPEPERRRFVRAMRDFLDGRDDVAS